MSLLKLFQNKRYSPAPKKMQIVMVTVEGKGSQRGRGSWDKILEGLAVSPGEWIAVVGCGVAHLWRCRIRVTEGGRNREISKNEGHDVTHVTCNTAPIIYFPLWYPDTVSDGRIR